MLRGGLEYGEIIEKPGMKESLRTSGWFSMIPQHWEIIKECPKNNQSQSHNKPNIVDDFNIIDTSLGTANTITKLILDEFCSFT